MALELVVTNPNLARDFKRECDAIAFAIRRASTLSYQACAKLIESRGVADIARSGKFGARWQKGLRVTTLPTSGFSVDNSIIITHTEPGAFNFEFGGIVRGKPLLWIPLSFARDAKGVRAKDFPGGLFRVDRPGKRSLLLSVRDKQPKYVSARRVRIPQKWHLRDIAADVVEHSFVAFYNRYMNNA